jgi:hypothetical protein
LQVEKNQKEGVATPLSLTILLLELLDIYYYEKYMHKRG